MSVTLKQIADMAGVHKSTVDKVIHDRPGVSEAKREQIRALLEQYGYESNPLAKALNYQKKKLTVGILLAHTAASAALRRGIERVRQDFASFNIALDLLFIGAFRWGVWSAAVATVTSVLLEKIRSLKKAVSYMRLWTSDLENVKCVSADRRVPERFWRTTSSSV